MFLLHYTTCSLLLQGVSWTKPLQSAAGKVLQAICLFVSQKLHAQLQDLNCQMSSLLDPCMYQTPCWQALLWAGCAINWTFAVHQARDMGAIDNVHAYQTQLLSHQACQNCMLSWHVHSAIQIQSSTQCHMISVKLTIMVTLHLAIASSYCPRRSEIGMCVCLLRCDFCLSWYLCKCAFEARCLQSKVSLCVRIC